MIPTLTIIGFSFAYLITGAVLTETIFAWPGIGSYAVESARQLDHPAIIGVTIVGGAAFLLANLVTDIASAFANPRIRIGSDDRLPQPCPPPAMATPRPADGAACPPHPRGCV